MYFAATWSLDHCEVFVSGAGEEFAEVGREEECREEVAEAGREDEEECRAQLFLHYHDIIESFSS